ncbi:MAG: TRAP transporter substrate-binding protein DctP [Asticcacaulis sp.]
MRKPMCLNAAVLAGAVLALVMSVSACAPTAPKTEAGEVVHVLRYASPYTPGHPLSQADMAWIDYIHTASKGRLKVEPLWAGGLISSEHNMIELRHGVADIATITPIYAKGGTHAIRVQSGFYGGERSIDQQVAVYKCLSTHYPELNREIEGLELLAVQGGNVLGLITRDRKVTKLSDLRGLRIRVPAELVPTMRKLGADPLDMPMSDVYSSLAKGVIDGVVAPADTLRSLHFGEVARYFNELHISRGAYPARAMSQKKFNTLPKDLQDLLRNSQSVWEEAIKDKMTAAQTSGADYAREQGMEFLPFDAAEQIRFDGLYNEQAAETARLAQSDHLNAEGMFTLAQRVVKLLNSEQGQNIGYDTASVCPKA